MFRRKRRFFSDKYKAQVAREALRGDKTLQEIAARYNIHPTQVGAWRDHARREKSKATGLQSLGSTGQFLAGGFLGVAAIALLLVLTSFLG